MPLPVVGTTPRRSAPNPDAFLIMQRLLFMVICLLVLVGVAVGDERGGQDAFASALRAAISAKDEQNLEALTFLEGASPEDRQRMMAMLKSVYFNGKEVDAIRFEPVPSDFDHLLIVQGRKIEPTAPPKGMVSVTFIGAENGQGNAYGAYTVVDGKCYFVGMKSTDLNWKGPPDKNLAFTVVGQGTSGLQIRGVWNASGVQLAKEFKSAGLTFWGQHFEELSVISASEDCDVTVTITEDGQTVFSKPLKGKGTVKYQKN